jgi:Protein of unknown function (DUF1045)
LLTAAPSARHAVYWVPERSHPLWHAGCEWLGRDPESGDAGQPPEHATSAWRYGFHATLVAPMHLACGCTPEQLQRHLRTVVATLCPFVLPPLTVQPLDDFLALRPVAAIDAMHPMRGLADACVVACGALRRPLGAAELTRRSHGSTDAVERAHVERWGYPYVFDRWRLHLTLSDAGRSHDTLLHRRAERHFAQALAEPLRVASVAVFTETAHNAPLRLTARLGTTV